MQHEIFLDKYEALSWIKNPKLTPSRKPKREIRFIDLFAGCGGLSYGIHQSSLKNKSKSICALAIDSNKAPLKVYEENIPHEKNSIINKNILDIINIECKSGLTENERTLQKKVGKIDILVGGPPCQGHSNLNNSTRRKDPRNNLYLACLRAVDIFNPNLIIIENVPTVVHSTEGVVQTTEENLKKIGYHVKHLNVNFLDLGIPQSRKRHVLVASKNKEFCESLTPTNKRIQIPTLEDFISDIEPENSMMFQTGKLSKDNIERVKFLFENNLYDLPNELRPSCHKDKTHSYKSSYGRLKYDKPAQTLTSGYGSMGQGRYIHPTERRTINSREAARIQGFPDSFSFSKVSLITELRQMIANSVPPQLTYTICNHFFNHS
ncbi:DNA cytosine methyltransferase [Microbulbifer rhizosphaerae]|uniref:DNA (cytosine-5-)-methyltransferase n=1 Tax=Microbulbifer rhizosphaerae TaxID=1562603 RepID=A0A7W4Z822_9GAMM|nr:DNA cytosine methyltransferase [Microbulbifer rhizosphaerae]MBB3060343.1 DNA (cytosine-5)-methyltransferase 1 [Microbulbifer rhizosphaerae]